MNFNRATVKYNRNCFKTKQLTFLFEIISFWALYGLFVIIDQVLNIMVRLLDISFSEVKTYFVTNMYIKNDWYIEIIQSDRNELWWLCLLNLSIVYCSLNAITNHWICLVYYLLNANGDYATRINLFIYFTWVNRMLWLYPECRDLW